MSPKPTSHLELIEPLQNFLETFTQELTEQKFVPAFRDELKRLLSALESLQQSEGTLQQIERGVERLREVFAPAGAKLLDTVKDLDSVMRGHADQVKEQAESVLRDLLQTHEQLEGALRSEAGLLKDQSAAGREALVRATADIEQRLTALTSHMDAIVRRLESRNVEVVETAPQSVTATAALPAALPDELRALISRSEHTLREELERYQEAVADLLTQGRADETERLTKLDHRLSEAINALGPRVQEELDQAVARLRDQIQTLILAEIETRALRPAEGAAAEGTVPADFSTALTASETRILREIAALQKSPRADSGADRVLKELTAGMEEAAQRTGDRIVGEIQKIRDTLAAMQRTLAPMREADQQSREQLALLTGGLDAVAKAQREQTHLLDEQLRTAIGRLDSQTRGMEQHAEEDRQLFQQLTAAFARVEQATTSTAELALADSRAQRDRIEAGIKDLRERFERGMTADSERTTDMLRQIAESWTEALETLRDFVAKTIAGRTDSIVARLEGIETRLTEAGQSGGSAQRELQTEIKRAGALFDERIQSLKSDTDAFVSAIETHVKAVSAEVAALRSKQDQSLAVLKDAIRLNYDESAARLKEVVESVYDHYIKQTTSVPQALERVAHLVQSISQGDQLTMQAIASDTKNVLSLSTERFEELVNDNSAIKKFFPLLNQRLEKQSAEFEAMRKAQVRQEKDLAAIQQALSVTRDGQDTQVRDLREDLSALRARSDEQFEAVQADLSRLQSELAAVQDEHLPTFRRELSSLLASKFDFIESTLHERQEAQRKELADREAADRAAARKNTVMIAALIGLSILTQILFHLMKTPGAGK